ncbi:MAG: hypothetical protein IPH57_03110 [Saprospiraceae bacterium]|nr:hypothetical protein [Saprospiraceae bacterium]
MLKFNAFVIYIFLANALFGQSDFHKSETELARYNDWFVNSDKFEHRKYALTEFNSQFLQILSAEGSFDYPFDSLKWISKLMPPDSSIRIFTWQLMRSQTEFDYFGVVQTRKNLYFLQDNKWQNTDTEYEEFTPANWYGQIYYNIHQYTSGNKTEYLLFGLKILKNREKIKTVEALDIQSGMLKLGKGIFEDTLNQRMFKNRVVLRTSFESNSRLSYDPELSMIIFDHTIIVPSSREVSAKPLIVADGSYHGYKLKDDKWMFVNNVFPEKFEAPPMLNPETETKKVKGEKRKK